MYRTIFTKTFNDIIIYNNIRLTNNSKFRKLICTQPMNITPKLISRIDHLTDNNQEGLRRKANILLNSSMALKTIFSIQKPLINTKSYSIMIKSPPQTSKRTRRFIILSILHKWLIKCFKVTKVGINPLESTNLL